MPILYMEGHRNLLSVLEGRPYEERLRSLCSACRRLRGDLSAVFNILRRGSRGVEVSTACLWWSVTGCEKWNCVRGGLGYILERGSSPRGCLGTGTGSSGKWSQRQPGQLSQAHGGILGVSCARPAVRFNDPNGSLLTQHILWVYDSISYGRRDTQLPSQNSCINTHYFSLCSRYRGSAYPIWLLKGMSRQ